MAVMRFASRCAVLPGPGKSLGHDVTIFHVVETLAIDGVQASPVAAAPAVAAPRKARRLMAYLSCTANDNPVSLAKHD